MHKRIGDILVEKGLLDQTQLNRVVDHANRKGMRLGEAGVELGLINPAKLRKVFGNNKYNFFYLNSEYFPSITKDIFDIKTILSHGVLPLGFKTEYSFFRRKKLLNIGLLSPEANIEKLPELHKLAQKKLGDAAFDEFKIYLILAEQYMEVLEHIYDFSEEKIRNFASAVDEHVLFYLDSGIKVINPDSGKSR